MSPMRRALVLVAVFVVGLLAASPTASAAQGPLRGVEFEFRADGFQGTVKSEAVEEKVDLTLYRHGQVAAYETDVEIDDRTVKARFGKLGALDFEFTPKPGGGCAGASEGTFHGTFDFTGERDFVEFALDHAHGTFLTRAPKQCEKAGGRRLPSPTFRGPVTALRRPPGPAKEAWLEAHSRRRPFRTLLIFTQPKKLGLTVFFSAFRVEKAEGMLIARGVQTSAGPGSFHWDLEAGTARLDPPRPLVGTAAFRRRAHGPVVWSGSLRAPVLGARSIRLAGPGMVAQLGEGSPLD